ncbi:MAG: hypothetical protein LAO20_20990 [Acidobacteriia bacterium]|nr:hypothetical protein [Terriglobia bacterium]
MWTIFILIFTLIFGRADAGKVSADPEAPAVAFCSLVARPQEYASKTVKIKATLASSTEFQILRDDSCPSPVNPSSGKSDLVEATFNQSQYDFKAAIHRKLTKLLKKRQQADVTVIGTFTDPGHYFGHQGCCRYQLDVQKLVSVEKSRKTNVEPPRAR